MAIDCARGVPFTAALAEHEAVRVSRKSFQSLTVAVKYSLNEKYAHCARTMEE